MILRGGKAPNYDASHVDAAAREIASAALAARLMIDLSHANSNKDFKRQIDVANDIAGQLAGGEDRVMGVMIESNLVEGRQNLAFGRSLEYGKSITDACIGWDDSLSVLETLAHGVRERRLAVASR